MTDEFACSRLVAAQIEVLRLRHGYLTEQAEEAIRDAKVEAPGGTPKLKFSRPLDNDPRAVAEAVWDAETTTVHTHDRAEFTIWTLDPLGVGETELDDAATVAEAAIGRARLAIEKIPTLLPDPPRPPRKPSEEDPTQPVRQSSRETYET